MSELPTVAVLGFGELGSVLAAGLTGAGVEVRAWSRPRAEKTAAQALDDRVVAAGALPCPRLSDAVAGAGVVIAAVPVGAASEVTIACAPLLTPGGIYVDMAPADPDDKRESADLVSRHGGAYADAAMLGTVVVEGFAAPVIASGPGAAAFAALGADTGMSVTAIPGTAGRATLVKLLRSVYTKGRSMLMLEMLAAARRHGVEPSELLDTFTGRSETVAFPDLVHRMISGLPAHADRWADELSAAVAVLERQGGELRVAAASASELHEVSAAGLARRFRGERAGSIEEVLATLVPGAGGPSSDRSGRPG